MRADRRWLAERSVCGRRSARSRQTSARLMLTSSIDKYFLLTFFQGRYELFSRYGLYCRKELVKRMAAAGRQRSSLARGSSRGADTDVESPDSPRIPGGCFSMASIDAEACSYCGVDDEEPPSTTVQFLSPRVVARFSRPKRPRAIARTRYLLPRRPPGRIPRSTFQTRAFRKAFYPDRARSRLERLALAGPKSPADPGPTRTGAGAFGRRAGGPLARAADAAR